MIAMLPLTTVVSLGPGEEEAAPRAKGALEVLVVAAVTGIRDGELGVAYGTAPGEDAAAEPQSHGDPGAIRFVEDDRWSAENRSADDDSDDNADRIPEPKLGRNLCVGR